MKKYWASDRKRMVRTKKKRSKVKSNKIHQNKSFFFKFQLTIESWREFYTLRVNSLYTKRRHRWRGYCCCSCCNYFALFFSIQTLSHCRCYWILFRERFTILIWTRDIFLYIYFSFGYAEFIFLYRLFHTHTHDAHCLSFLSCSRREHLFFFCTSFCMSIQLCVACAIAVVLTVPRSKYFRFDSYLFGNAHRTWE